MRLALQNANEHNKKVAEEVKFTICGETMEQVKEFCYLGRVVIRASPPVQQILTL